MIKIICNYKALFYKAFLPCFLLFVFSFSFSCKSLPPAPATEAESDTVREAQAADGVEDDLLPEPPDPEDEALPEPEYNAGFGDDEEPAGLADEGDIPSEPPVEPGASLAEQEEEIRDLLNRILDLLQEPPSLPVAPEPAPPAPAEPPPSLPPPAVTPAPPVSPPPPPVIPPAAVQPEPEAAIDPPPVEEEEQQAPAPERPSVLDRLVLPSRPLPETSGGDIVFSRIVRVFVGQTIEIPFRGTGWVYLGEIGNRRGIAYDSRRLDVVSNVVEGQSFIFRAEAAGTYILKFYKQDFIQDYIINDHVQIIVGEAEAYQPGRYVDRGRVIAEPRWPAPELSAGRSRPGAAPETQQAPSETGPIAGPAAEAPPVQPQQAVPQQQRTQPQAQPIPPSAPQREIPPPATQETVPPQEVPEAVPPSDPQMETPFAESDPAPAGDAAEYVLRARQEFDAGRVEQALGIMEAMQQHFPGGTDEAWWLIGQLLEANSPSRDVRLSLEYYRRLTREYPQSPRAADAQRRIAYLERFYFNIR